MSYKKYEKILTNEEFDERQLKNYELIKSYDIGFEGDAHQIELEVDKDIYDEYVIGVFSDGEIKKLKTKKTKNKDKKIIVKATTESCGEHIVYGRNANKLIIIEAIMGLMLFLSGFGYAYSNVPEFKDKVDDFIIETFNIDTPTAPEISGGSNTYAKERIVKVVKDAKSNSGISHYEYCISSTENMNKCNWIKTTTKNVVINTTGVYYVAFRGVSNDGTKGNISNIVNVKIDVDTPVIEDIKITYENEKFKVEIISKDNASEDLKYYYKVDDGNYIEVEKDFELDIEGKHNITIRVEDPSGNFIEVEKEVDFDEIKDIATTPENETVDENETDDNTTEEEDSTNDPENGDKEDDSDDTNVEEKIEIPEINLDKVPTTFEYKEKYEVPSYYKFDSKGGEVICLADGKEIIKDTSKLRIGKHLITCEAIGNNGYTTRVEKEVEVTLIDVDEEIWDGYIILTLYYPENSTDWQWRLGNENEIRTGYDNTGWQDYVGPIKVRLEDVSNVYIKYKLGGEEIIEAPNGKMVVDIRPSKYTIKTDEKTKVTIFYDETSTKNEYKINDGSWEKYDGSFEVGPNTVIEARASKTEKVYDEDGNLLMEYPVVTYDSVFISEYIPVDADPNGGYTGSIGGIGFGPSNWGGSGWPGGYTTPTSTSKPSYSLDAPDVDVAPGTYTDKVTVTITTKYEPQVIYYSLNGSSYKEYTEPFEVTQNGYVKTYYIRKSDGQVSATLYRGISNIKRPDMPYVRIDADPNPYIESSTDKVKVSIAGSDYNTLEYSLDGVYYKNYTGSFELTQAATVYARATNKNGTTYEKLVINNLPQITTPEELEVEIINQDLYDNGLATASTVKIVYDKDATTKLYKVGNSDSWHEYNGEFTINGNATIYAYCSNDNGYGEKSKSINSLYTGMVDPIITANPKNNLKSTATKVEITYDKNAVTKSYRIGNGELKTYTSSFEVYENTVVYAESYDALGNRTYAIYQIDNIVPKPEVFILDKGMYYLIKLNYPTTSSESGREYKWKTNGEWKVYPTDGIILIKQQYKDEVLDMKDGDVLKLRDENGKETIFTGDYYVLDMPASQMVENLFMRWDTIPPKTPEITVEPTTWTSEAVVKINYPENMKKKQYKIVYEDGTSTGWKEYDKAFKVDKNNTTIYAKCQDELEVYSKIAEKTITNIDNGNPGVRYVNIIGTTQKSITIEIDGIDSVSGIKEYYYSIDGKNYKLSKTNKITIDDLYANSEYKISTYIVDNAGNEGEVYEVIGKTRNILAPEISISPELNEWSTEKTLTITHEDPELDLYYSKNKGKTWVIYEEPVVLDQNTSIMAKSSDGKNEGITAIYSVETIDKTLPEVHDIHVLERSSRFIVSVNSSDRECDIKEYYFSIDGENYTKSIENKYEFTGLNNETEYTIYVKTMNSAGLMSEVSKINATTTEIGPIGYFVSPENDTWAYEKEVEISYPTEEDQGYINGYSIDGGKTWLEYTDPILVEEEDQTIIARVIDGPNVKVANSFKVTKIDRTVPTLNLDSLPDTFYTSDTYNLPSAYTVDETKSGGKASCFVNGVEYTNTDQLPGGSYTLECKAVTGAGVEATISKDVTAILRITKNVDSILDGMNGENLENGYYVFRVNNGSETVSYPIHMYVFEGDQVWSEDKTFGDANDIATASNDAKYMVAVKVKGDLTVNSGYTVTTASSAYGGPKGLTLYVDGKLENNGTITMTGKGAKAPGQNVYLWKNKNGTYEYVPAAGATGGTGVSNVAGKVGNPGSGRQTGGGGSGNGFSTGTTGIGGTGTSYSGGAGSGGIIGINATSGDGSSTGGAGGIGRSNHWFSQNVIGIGGTGNPGGVGSVKNSTNASYSGNNGTGGLLTIYTDSFVNNGTITADGVAGRGCPSRTCATGGASGGGSINIFSNDKIIIKDLNESETEVYNRILGNTTANGGAGGTGWRNTSGSNTASVKSGAGGKGTVSIGKITNGTYISLQDRISAAYKEFENSKMIEANDIITALDKTTSSGIYTYAINNMSYRVHTYVFNGNQIWSENQTFGDVDDIATYSTNASNMVAVKVDGNLTINSGVTVTAYSDIYGGPKGLALFVSGDLNNNGIISMTGKGAKAEGEDVYLWKNSDGTYEYVPAVGATGGASVSNAAANSGNPGSGRQTGGGGSGAGFSTGTSGPGGSGTSYSGGSGGGGVSGKNITAASGSSIGGAGGNAESLSFFSNTAYAIGGTGNPGGSGKAKDAAYSGYNGNNGTGGLLIIYSNNYYNNGTVEAAGITGKGCAHNICATGGSSGGGSINIFYSNKMTSGLTNVSGGLSTDSRTSSGSSHRTNTSGAGGSGTVTYTQIGAIN